MTKKEKKAAEQNARTAEINKKHQVGQKTQTQPFNLPIPRQFNINLTITASQYGILNNSHTFQDHQTQNKVVQSDYKAITTQLNLYTNNVTSQPGLAAINLKESQAHLNSLCTNTEPILTRLQAGHADVTNAMDIAITGAQEKAKQHSQSSDPIGREMRDMFQKLITNTNGSGINEKAVAKLIETPNPNSKPQELWASLAQSPVAQMFLTEGQQRICQANVLQTSAIDFTDLQKQEVNLSSEIKSINDQIGTLQTFIKNGTNKLRQLYPNSFEGLN